MTVPPAPIASHAYRIRAFLLVLFAGVMAALTPGAVLADALPADHAQRMTAGLELFQKEIRGVLTDHCLRCHGGEKVRGGLNLGTREGLLQGGEDGPVVIPFRAKGSRLLESIAHTREPFMPSKSDPLSPALVARIEAWIDLGAPYDRPLIDSQPAPARDRGRISGQDRTGWAVRPLQVAVPPSVRDVARVRTPVDRFIVSRLESAGLDLRPPADRRTLLRRAAFDLTGLPPTPEDLQAFLADSAPDAWSRAVNRLLDHPGYGERWARHWLDVARFAESSGFEHDYDRVGAYHYRDFVIRALNADMPFDQFVRWQLAGDEFEPGNPEALMATGFLGAGVFPTQITANEVERVRYDAMDDMLATTGTAMLGLTVGCARCHDHKFDPIPSQDYYRLLATFTTTVRSVIDLDLAPEENRHRLETHAREVQSREGALRALEKGKLAAGFEAWLKQGAPWTNLPIWQPLQEPAVKAKSGAVLEPQSDGSFFATGSNPDTDVYTWSGGVTSRRIAAIRIEALADTRLPKGGPGRADNGNFGLSRIRVFAVSGPGGGQQELHLVRPRASFEQNSGNLSVASSLDKDPHSGWAVDPRFGTNHAAVFDVDPPWVPAADGGSRLEVRLEFEVNARHAIGRSRVSVSEAQSPPWSGQTYSPEFVAAHERFLASGAAPSRISDSDRERLFATWKTTQPQWQAVHAELDEWKQKTPKPKLTPVLACAEGFPPLRMHTQGADYFPETFFLKRGNPELKNGVAKPGFLQVLAPPSGEVAKWTWQPPAGARYSGRRRTLATWMTDANGGAGHLLARVIVNRLWQHHFGTGLVATPNDFGAQGAKPTHPELLDWLASELIRGGWQLKPIHRLLMNSAVYCQSTPFATDRMEKDPSNALLSRRVRQRLEAESIRDALLAVSGVLDPTMYGPGTLDEASRRRSIYFTVKRSQLIPAMQAFDAPEPLVSQGTRPTTTIAPQALLLMNNPQVRGWAAAFAERLEAGSSDEAAPVVRRAYSLALNRSPSDEELRDGISFLESSERHYRGEGHVDPRRGARIDFAQVVLSLNEFIYVD